MGYVPPPLPNPLMVTEDLTKEQILQVYAAYVRLPSQYDPLPAEQLVISMLTGEVVVWPGTPESVSIRARRLSETSSSYKELKKVRRPSVLQFLSALIWPTAAVGNAIATWKEAKKAIKLLETSLVYQCGRCGIRIESLSLTRDHVVTAHGPGATYEDFAPVALKVAASATKKFRKSEFECKCGCVFSSKRALRTHEWQEHAPMSASTLCGSCGEITLGGQHDCLEAPEGSIRFINTKDLPE